MKQTTRRVLLGSSAFLLLFVAVLVARALGGGYTSPTTPVIEGLSVNADQAAESLAEYVRIDTSVPPGIPKGGTPPHVTLLVEKYAKPLGLEYRVLADRILFMRLRADKPEGPPLVLLSHADVVPVAPEEKEKWSHPPFGGQIADGFVWGRGAIDNKASTICELEAIASLKKAGMGPKRDIILLVMPDEEISGHEGAELFVKEHIDLLDKPYALIDEGAAVIPDQIPGHNVAAIAVGEKQYVTLKIEVDAEAGHSSMPKPSAAPTTLARALGRLVSFQLPTKRLPPVERMLDRMSDHVPFGQKILLRNRWVFGPVVERVLSQGATMNAMLRSTFALTVLHMGVKDNVVPAHAEALVNFRLLPGDSRDAVVAEVTRVMAEPNVKVTVLESESDTPIAPTEGPVWSGIEAVLASTIPNAVVAPIISPATTDARFFARAGIPTYRVLPFTLDTAERQGIHGINERLSKENIAQGIRVYAHLMARL